MGRLGGMRGDLGAFCRTLTEAKVSPALRASLDADKPKRRNANLLS